MSQAGGRRDGSGIGGWNRDWGLEMEAELGGWSWGLEVDLGLRPGLHRAPAAGRSHACSKPQPAAASVPGPANFLKCKRFPFTTHPQRAIMIVHERALPATTKKEDPST